MFDGLRRELMTSLEVLYGLIAILLVLSVVIAGLLIYDHFKYRRQDKV